MSSSKSSGFRNVPPPAGGSKPSSLYARFIPREELDSFAAWKPGSIDGAEADAATHFAAQRAAEPVKTPEQLVAEQLNAARQGGYHDGYLAFWGRYLGNDQTF